ncbi:MAG: ribosomal protein S18-alanine N-acetyltransferase [Bacteriovorax sp.]|nr:ribosomal protein S18-alanine N-acetyltransferase [Bacteriovorax sp.]
MTQKYKVILRAEDLNASALFILFEMDRDHFPTPWSKEAWYKVFFSVGQRLLLIAEEDDVILGFALFDITSADSFAHLLKIVVGPNVRGVGIGKNLLSASIMVLKERNIKSFFLEVEEHNSHAINLYESLGFKIIHQKKQFYSSGTTALIMTLNV